MHALAAEHDAAVQMIDYAMVHFEYDAVISYIQDGFRILKYGGRALFHHSNLDTRPDFDYKDNPD
jgi:hypothetical protein